MTTPADRPFHMGDEIPIPVKFLTDRFGNVVTPVVSSAFRRDQVSRLFADGACGEEMSFVVEYGDDHALGVLIEYELVAPPDPLVFGIWEHRVKREQPVSTLIFAYGGPDSVIPVFGNRWAVAAVVPEDRCLHLRSKDIARSMQETF